MSLSKQLKGLMLRFSNYLVSSPKNRFPHAAVEQVLTNLKSLTSKTLKLLGSPEEKLLDNLVEEILKNQRESFKGERGKKFFEAIVNLLDYLVVKVAEALDYIEVLVAEKSGLQNEIDKLNFIIQAFEDHATMKEGVTSQEEEEDDSVHFMNHPHYLFHYLARSPGSLTTVSVVLWKSSIPGVWKTHAGFPLIYIDASYSVTVDSTDWRTPPSTSEYFSSSVSFSHSDIEAVKSALRRNVTKLFANHSNIVSVRCSVKEGRLVIVLCVPVKSYIPVGELLFPQLLDGYPVIVVEGIPALCGLKELGKVRPLMSGSAIAPEPVSSFSLDDNAFFSYYGTFGGLLDKDSKSYAVTCGHCCSAKDYTLFAHGTSIFQPSAFSAFLHSLGAEKLPEFKRREVAFGCIKALSFGISEVAERLGMTEQEVPNHFLNYAESIGHFQGGVFGPLGSSNVDVALVSLDVECVPDNDLSYIVRNEDNVKLKSPPLRIALDSNTIETAISMDSTFPPHILRLYGKGATTPGLSFFLLDKIETECFLSSTFIKDVPTKGQNYFRCLCAEIVSNSFNKGDSGCWIWTSNWTTDKESDNMEQKKLLGMGFAAEVMKDGKYYAFILPMKTVLESAQEILTK